MAEDFFPPYKDEFFIKPPKPSPLVLRLTVLVIVTICGVYICSFCLKQITNQTTSSVEVIERPNSEFLHLHYPHPQTFHRAECEGNPVRFFVIVSMQRSGSGWFETLLNSHINVSSNGEIFSVKDRRENLSSIIQTLDRVYNLDWLSSASKNECSAAVGFKWMLNQGLMEYHEQIVEYLNKRGVSIIFLFRRNLLRRMVSLLANSYDQRAKLLNGTHKSHVHSLEEARTLLKYKPIINSTSLISDLREMELTAAKALDYFGSTRHMIVYYEDLIKNRSKLVDLQDFLRLPRKELRSQQVKIHQGPLREHIQNWDDVTRTLNGTAYWNFLLADY